METCQKCRAVIRFGRTTCHNCDRKPIPQATFTIIRNLVDSIDLPDDGVWESAEEFTRYSNLCDELDFLKARIKEVKKEMDTCESREIDYDFPGSFR